MMLDHLRRMGRYNRWANRRLFEACTALPEGTFEALRPVFFRSISGTLNHLLVTDRLWLDRITRRPYGGGKLDDQPFPDLASLREAREALDEDIVMAIDATDEAALVSLTTYRMMTKPQENRVQTALCWLHMFNHETHHRGQVHDQLSQTDVAPPPLDLIYFIHE